MLRVLSPLHIYKITLLVPEARPNDTNNLLYIWLVCLSVSHYVSVYQNVDMGLTNDG